MFLHFYVIDLKIIRVLFLWRNSPTRA